MGCLDTKNKMDLAKPKSGALVRLFSSPSLFWIETVIKIFSTDCRRVSSRGFRDQSRVGTGEQLTRSGSWGRCSHNLQSNWHGSNQQYLQTNLVVFPDVLRKFGEYFLLQMKCMMSASVEGTFYRAWLMISVWEIEPKLKETTVSYFALRHHWWIEEWEEWVSKAIPQNRMGFFYIFSWSC